MNDHNSIDIVLCSCFRGSHQIYQIYIVLRQLHKTTIRLLQRSCRAAVKWSQAHLVPVHLMPPLHHLDEELHQLLLVCEVRILFQILIPFTVRDVFLVFSHLLVARLTLPVRLFILFVAWEVARQVQHLASHLPSLPCLVQGALLHVFLHL